jgi:methylated-DNA-[protein]-cysteine S-methyltransferase
VLIAVTTIDTPIGPINVATTDAGLLAAEMLTPPDLFLVALERLHGTVDPAGQRTKPRHRQLDLAVSAYERYFAGDPEPFELPLDFEASPSRAWDRTVLGGVRSIPWGQVSSYGRVARRIGKSGAARAVGGAVARNPISIAIPCHRVIAGDGTLGGYGGGWWGGHDRLLGVKRALLELEGIRLPVRRFAE